MNSVLQVETRMRCSLIAKYIHVHPDAELDSLPPKVQATQTRLHSLAKTFYKILVFVLNSDTHHATPLEPCSFASTHIPWKTPSEFGKLLPMSKSHVVVHVGHSENLDFVELTEK